MSMNTVRTTVVFKQDLHKQLSLQAVALGISLSDLINRKLSNGNVGASKSSIQAQIENDLAFFENLGKKMGTVNWSKAVRRERDRDSR